MPIGQSETDQQDPITLLYMVQAGNHEIVVVVDPDNNIVETNENNNIESAGTMSSPPRMDVGRESSSSIQFIVIIMGATFSLIEWQAM